MTRTLGAVGFKKRVLRRRRRRYIPRKRIFKIKSLIPRRTLYIHKGRFIMFKHRTQRKRLFPKRFNTYVMPNIPKTKRDWSPKKSAGKTKTDWGAQKKDWGKVWKTSAYKKIYKPKDTGEFPTELADWMKEQYKREILKAHKPEPKSTFKKVERRGGKRKYVWKGKWYGKMKPLGPKLIFEVFPTHKYYMYIRARKSYGDHMAVIKAIRKAMQKVLDDLVKYGKIIINKYVPEETGDLRKSMIDSLEKSKVRGMTIKVELDTGNIQYANPVNNMPESKIRHDMGKNKQIGRRSGKYLHDPKAIENWFQHITMNLNAEAGKLLRVMIIDIMDAFGFRYYKKKPTLKSKLHTKLPLRTVIQSDQPLRKSARVAGPMRTQKYERPTALYEETGSVMEQDKHEMSKHVRMMGWRQQLEKATKESVVVHYPRNLIMKMFKIRGLYKGNRVY